MDSFKNYFRLLAEDKPNDLRSAFFYPLLTVASWFYGAGVKVFRSLYETKVLPRKRLPFPVVSVGNLTWGGTGKTPFVEFLARKISAHRKVPLVLTRGYSHDEVEELQQHLPAAIIGVGKDRAKVAEKVRQAHKHVDIAVLDDGLQHVALDRDADIIVVNSLNPFGNEQMIPRGILREPLSVLKRATVIVLTHVNLVKEEELKKLKEKVARLAPNAQVVETLMEPLFLYRAKNKSRISIEKMAGKRVTTFAAVGTPRSFQLVLQRSHIKTVRNFEFLDHHDYTAPELGKIKEIAHAANSEEIVTTEKDFYRSRELITQALNPLVLAARLRIVSGEEVLTDRLFRLLGVKH
ncbi:MAG TPA: tetraacyldisaccharide 4'-kinase [Candidatus Omnitrophota bacterium]|nr:tetraacyldisaccharide 4'-kinase [Candidatus Omnitrophota bacterium]HPS36131.1 tetraacyldisaccharide 4'-kinase [Candidatus Omnitrophota bacterium]